MSNVVYPDCDKHRLKELLPHGFADEWDIRWAFKAANACTAQRAEIGLAPLMSLFIEKKNESPYRENPKIGNYRLPASLYYFTYELAGQW